jgi:two-component system sensor histidine kinase ChiS
MDGKNKKIIFIEDSIVDRKLLKAILQQAGFEVDAFEKYKEFLDNLKNNHYSLAILDILMPEMDGITLLKKIREKYSMVDLPVIMVTAISSLDKLFECLKNGANDFVTKPYNKNELELRISSIIDYNIELQRHVQIQIEQEKYYTAIKLLATLSHYINNIITPIMISSEICKRSRTKAHIDELVHYSYNGAKQVAGVISSLREVLGESGGRETKYVGLEGMIYDLEKKLEKFK